MPDKLNQNFSEKYHVGRNVPYYQFREGQFLENAGPSETVTILQRHDLVQDAPTPHFQPQIHDYIETLATPGKGIDVLLAPEKQRLEGVSFGIDDAYGAYHWELFFHVPMLMANRLSQSQRFEAAQKWYHKIFDPTQGLGNMPGDKPFWRFDYFKRTEVQTLEEMITRLSENAYKDWLAHPFLPHKVAKHRPQAYMTYTVMKYLDNLIAWADNLFRRDTMESINEAAQLYILAAKLLGPKPQIIPRTFERPATTYQGLNGEGQTSPLFNPEVEAALIFPFANQNLPSGPEARVALGMIETPFFCIPPNRQVLDYWDTIGDRLFKIRHCRNIEGVERQLALFDPPIDPRRLIEAAAAGVDISSVAGDLYAPMPHYRFPYILQKAQEFCNEVKAFGGALLSAIEKKDAETLALMRTNHEKEMLDLLLEVRKLQISEAEATKEGLLKNRDAAEHRLKHVLRRLGETNVNVPAYQRDSPYQYNPTSPFSRLEISDFERGIKLLKQEYRELIKLNEAYENQDMASQLEFIASIYSVIPNFNIQPFGVGTTFGGGNFASLFNSIASHFKSEANKLSNEASTLSRTGNYILRQDDYIHQANQAGMEIMQIDRQLIAADLRIDIAEKEKQNQEKQIEHAETVLAFMQDKQQKFTQAALYQWMAGRLSELYYQCYRMAYDLAKQAERCYQHELGLESSNLIPFGNWDNNQKGLLAGERLHLALKQLEKAYLDQNRRELELTKHISLNLLNPLALLQLRETGKCDFAIPEELFDLDFPGHYFRRIKSVSISIPCVAGPYTTINATLRLKKSSVRVKTGGEYARNPEDNDDRFRDYFAGVQSIATSSAQNDAGLFELNFRDERYLPFEGAGAVSEWTLEMMEEESLRQFDYNTIADVIVHLRYTAREDGNLKTAAVNHLKGLTNALGQVPLQRLFSLRYDFPNEWHAWTKRNQPLSVKLEKRHFPYFAQLGELTIDNIKAYEKGKKPSESGVELSSDGDVNAGWNVAGNLDKTKDDWFLMVNYTI